MPSPQNLPAAWQPLFDSLRRLRQNWVSRGWSWDSRLSCITSSFSVQFEADARAALAQTLPTEWTASTLPKAPPRLRTLAEQFGDVRAGQLLLTGGSLEGLFAFGLWWPWGNGQTISLRVGLADVPVNKEPYPTFRELFGVEA
jgi:hypothetical protein